MHIFLSKLHFTPLNYGDHFIFYPSIKTLQCKPSSLCCDTSSAYRLLNLMTFAYMAYVGPLFDDEWGQKINKNWTRWLNMLTVEIGHLSDYIC